MLVCFYSRLTADDSEKTLTLSLFHVKRLRNTTLKRHHPVPMQIPESKMALAHARPNTDKDEKREIRKFHGAQFFFNFVFVAT